MLEILLKCVLNTNSDIESACISFLRYNGNKELELHGSHHPCICYGERDLGGGTVASFA